MKCPEETRQQLWDLIYDLLTPEEAEALQVRITTEPDMARAYSSARLQSDLVAAAARRDVPRVTLKTPEDVLLGEPAESRSESSAVIEKPAKSSSIARALNWLACIAALALVSLAGFGYFKYGAPWASAAAREEREELAQNYVRLVLAGPRYVKPGETQSYTINALDFDGAPKETTEISYRVVDANNEARLEDLQSTDENGLLQISIPGNLVAENTVLRIETPDSAASEPLVARLSTTDSLAGKIQTAESPRWVRASGELDSLSRVEFENHSGMSGKLVMTADNGGRQVARQAVPPADESGVANETRLMVAPSDKVSGATRVTLYDYKTNPPEPLFERYYFVSPTNKLKIDRSDALEVYAPGDKVELQLQVSAEGGEPLAAELRVAVVDETKLAANGRWADDSGNKDFALAYEGTNKDQPPKVLDDRLFVMSDTVGAAVPPLVLDNSSAVQAAFQTAVSELDRGREGRLRLVGQISLFGGVVLLGALLIAFGLRTTGGSRALLPALVAAIGCALFGFIWTTAQVDNQGNLAFARFGNANQREEAAAEREIAQNDLKSLNLPMNGSMTEYEKGAPLGNSSPKSSATPTDPSATTSGAGTFSLPKADDPAREAGTKNQGDETKKPAQTLTPAPKPTDGPAAGGPGSGATPSLETVVARDPKPSEPSPQPTRPEPVAPISPPSISKLGFEKTPSGADAPGKKYSEAREDSAETVETFYSRSVATGEDGRAIVRFTLPEKPGVYRVFIEGRSGERLGLWRGKVEARLPLPAKESPEP